MALWLVRAGSHGERVKFDLENKVAAIGWEEIGDLSQFASREEILAEITEKYPEKKPATHSTWASELFSFCKKMEVGDFVAMPLGDRASIFIGKIKGDYQYKSDNPINSRHIRVVDWIDEYPRTSFRQDILNSLGSLLAVGRVRRDFTDDFITALISGQNPPLIDNEEVIETSEYENIEQSARDQISNYIHKNFHEHALEKLVGAVLQAQGYQVRVSPLGPDGGVDILAGSGPLGFDPPRLAVQVKSGQTPVDVDVLRAFMGVINSFGAEHGLIVAWSGYRGTVENEAAKVFFKIRLWDADDLVKNIQTNYDLLPEDIQAELPLKKIWILLPEEEE